MKKRLLSAVLALALICSTVPGQVFALEEGAAEPGIVELSGNQQGTPLPDGDVTLQQEVTPAPAETPVATEPASSAPTSVPAGTPVPAEETPAPTQTPVPAGTPVPEAETAAPAQTPAVLPAQEFEVPSLAPANEALETPEADPSVPEGEGTVESPYLISTEAQLFWFAELVNGNQENVEKNAAACATLTADISISADNPWTPLGSTEGFNGTFDGAGHTIFIPNINSTEETNGLPVSACFVLYLKEDGVIEDLTVEGKITSDAEGAYIAGICAMNQGTIRNCANKAAVTGSNLCCAGGICVVNMGTIKDCQNLGMLTAKGENAEFYSVVGGISALNEGEIQNCISTGEFDTVALCYRGAICGSQGVQQGGIIANCYWLQGTAANAAGIRMGEGGYIQASAKTAEEFASGEVAWLLNGAAAENPIWCQNLGDGGSKDAIPVLNPAHGIVYPQGGTLQCNGLSKEGYTNSLPGAPTTTDEHRFGEDGFCTVCGQYQPATQNDGIYQIATPGQLFWFAALVNGDKRYAKFEDQNLKANAVLLNDIDLKNREWKPIGDFIPSYPDGYSGTFDGAGYTISGLSITGYADCVGFVGRLDIGGTIQNLTLSDTCSISGGIAVGGLCGSNRGRITGCQNNGGVFGMQDVGGLCGANSGTIERSINRGSVNGQFPAGISVQGSSSIGGIVGNIYVENAVIKNCYNTGAVTGDVCVGGLCGQVENGKVFSCYNIGKVVGEDRVEGLIGDYYYGAVFNCLWLNTCLDMGDDDSQDNPYDGDPECITERDFASGYACWYLNDQLGDDGIWKQTLGEDPYPQFTGALCIKLMETMKSIQTSARVQF